MSVPTVFVTGCAGYVGSVLVGRLLRAGCKVIGVDDLSVGSPHALLGHVANPRFEFHRLDVRDFPSLMMAGADKADVVVPLAAVVGAPACQKRPEYAKEVNQDAVGALVKRLSRDQRVVYPNTNSGYGETDGSSECTEADPLSPISVYGVTKCEGEKYVLDHPNSVVFRLATVFGASPRMRLDLMVNDFAYKLSLLRKADFYRALSNPFTVYEPHFKRNFVGVQDVARAFIYAMQHPETKGVYNLGLPTANLTKMELAHRVCDVVGVPRELVAVGHGRDPDRRNYIVSNAKLLATGFKFEHGLDDGIREVAAISKMFTHEQAAAMRNA